MNQSTREVRPGLLTGVDLVPVADVAASIEQFGDRYLSRVYTPHELSSCRGTAAVAARSFAARFAAKEAVMKVLRPGHGDAVDWRSIEIRRDGNGACTLRLTDRAAELARSAGVVEISVALAHEGEFGVAVVVARCADDAAPATTLGTGRTTDAEQDS